MLDQAILFEEQPKPVYITAYSRFPKVEVEGGTLVTRGLSRAERLIVSSEGHKMLQWKYKE